MLGQLGMANYMLDRERLHDSLPQPISCTMIVWNPRQVHFSLWSCQSSEIPSVRKESRHHRILGLARHSSNSAAWRRLNDPRTSTKDLVISLFLMQGEEEPSA